MSDLSELSLHTSYHKGRDDIARDFYLPCMRRAVQFDRAVGYFRSTAFIIAWPALRGFIQRGGRIRVLCSQVLADEDIDALAAGYEARADWQIAERLKREVDLLLDDLDLREPAAVLAGLVARNMLELQVAILKAADLPTAKGRIFHDKLGIFRDSAGHRVVFKGSMNETWNGLSSDGNLESVDVAASWMGGRDLDRCDAEESYFSELWARTYPGLIVRPFPEVARDQLVRAAPTSWQAILEDLERRPRSGNAEDPRGRNLKSHQSLGLASWETNGRRGILAFATGAGKTFTAITAMREAITRFNNPVLVVVPDRTLFRQWDEELRETLSDLKVRLLRAGAGHARWREALRRWTAPGGTPRVVLATLQTAAGEEFRRRLSPGAHLMILADEVHRLGSRIHRQLMADAAFGPRLGLSATPERFGDSEGTAAIFDFFGPVLVPRYSLADAIRDNILTPYFYRPHALQLEADEAEAWSSLTRQISRLHAQTQRREPPADLARRIAMLRIRRARIVKQARGKVDLGIRVLRENFTADQKWLVYCDDVRQLAAVEAGLSTIGIQPLAYHSAMSGGREQTLRWLVVRGGVVVAIKCLDEGVDIPSVTHALILASSKNPREFVQRRGRVLRRAPGKALAFIHDAIVMPPKESRDSSEYEDGEAKPDSLTAGELARAIEFATHAANPASATDLQQIALRAGLDWHSLIALGEEDADE